MKPCVFIHTGRRQWLPALVGRHSLLRASRHADAFDVRFLKTDDHAFLRERDGQPFLQQGDRKVWRYADAQSFTPLRFMPPQVMGYEGRAVVIDPDIFALADIWDLLSCDMGGKAILARPRFGTMAPGSAMISAVMLLDCARLAHWRCAADFAEAFAFRRDYAMWLALQLEPPQIIGRLADEWNDLDYLSPGTRLLHNTQRRTQPWLSGLPIDFGSGAHSVEPPAVTSWLDRLRKRPRRDPRSAYQPHPDRRQEQLFFGLLAECLRQGTVTEAMLREEMALANLRPDAFALLDGAPPLPAAASLPELFRRG
jgi:hypothetical protein